MHYTMHNINVNAAELNAQLALNHIVVIDSWLYLQFFVYFGASLASKREKITMHYAMYFINKNSAELHA